jgi:hypothetical protein
MPEMNDPLVGESLLKMLNCVPTNVQLIRGETVVAQLPVLLLMQLKDAADETLGRLAAITVTATAKYFVSFITIFSCNSLMPSFRLAASCVQ